MRHAMTACALTLAFCATLVAPGAAGAANTFDWSISGKGLEELKVKSESLSVKALSAFKITSVGGVKVECSTASGESLAITASGGVEGTIALSSCTVPGNKFCTVKSIKLKVVGQFVERFGESFVGFKGIAKEPLGTFLFEGELCVLPEENELNGTIAGKLSLGESTERVIAFSESSAKGAEAQLFLGAEKASIPSGELSLALSGAQKGKSWGMAVAAIGLGPGTELDFSSDPVGTVRNIALVNNSLVNGTTVTLLGEWIERSGLFDEGDFELVTALGTNPCNMPVKKAKGAEFDHLIGSGATCEVGVKFISGIRGVPGEAYVIEYGPLFWISKAKFPVKA
jgi:hypothetical protein